LAGLAAGLTCGLVGASAQVQQPGPIRRRWPTGNARLAPPARAEGLVFYAGDKTVGAISPKRQEPLWGGPHGLAGAAVFRPRTGGGRLMCGGLREVACWNLMGGERYWRYRHE
jgi:hypothetical protein